MKIGEGNARFIADLANGMATDTLREKWKAGEYPGLNEQWARDNLAFRGRK